MALSFEMHRLTWFKTKWKKTLASPEPFCMMNIGETNLPSRQETTQETVVTDIAFIIPSTP